MTEVVGYESVLDKEDNIFPGNEDTEVLQGSSLEGLTGQLEEQVVLHRTREDISQNRHLCTSVSSIL